MKLRLSRWTCLVALWTTFCCGLAWAESFASSASSAGSASIGSLSDSVQASSRSVSGDRQVAEGEYRVIEVADLADRPELLRLKLQLEAAASPAEAATELTLTLPRQALATRALAVGDRVHARHRPYGIEFAHAGATAQQREAFFLALADDWKRELDARPLKAL